jgi:integrase/recombinase XerD
VPCCALLAFASARCGKTPSQLGIHDLDAPLIPAFLAHLEHDRGNSPATRNNRLAAVHSLFSYIALLHPEHGATVQRILAIPPKRSQRNIVTYRTRPVGRGTLHETQTREIAGNPLINS